MYVCIRIKNISKNKCENVGKYEPVSVHPGFPLLMGAGTWPVILCVSHSGRCV